MSARQGNTAFRGDRWTAVVSLAAAILLLGLPRLHAQDEAAPAKTEDKAAAKADKLPGAEEVPLNTEDGVTLAATYWPGTKGKDSIPVVLLHGFKAGETGSRKDYASLAPYLQEKLGCAVLAVDLRGHGDSTQIGNSKIDAAKMRPTQFGAMSAFDMVAIRNFLIDENNGGGKSPRLNLNKLCIVGAGMGATVAVQFARDDWNLGPIGPCQMGNFTKALVLLSPELTAHGLKLKEPLADRNVRQRISVLLLFGKEGPTAKDAKSVFNLLERYHPVPADPEKRKKEQSLFYFPLDGSLQGTKLLGEPALDVPWLIEQFITHRLVENAEARSCKWTRLRKDPYVKEKGE